MLTGLFLALEQIQLCKELGNITAVTNSDLVFINGKFFIRTLKFNQLVSVHLTSDPVTLGKILLILFTRVSTKAAKCLT